ncbi:PREDICTED: F-box/LRR-repeat protein At2g40920-like [Camelina sativa]|uniref:F-box/LRR-repeat protein At2g40920-like n=1 Tax=Camelina sativa TaxID=90675 RepID=A0ABM0YU03_CAMSA|nr:PREDICTED: F-box/LRR-repeat protein At2g40920-like [Camelina sativa]
MKRLRVDLKQAESKEELCQSNSQVVSLRDSDQIQIMDAKGENSLTMFPAEFRENIDLVIEILMRLPTKSLMRFKCVSKEWSSLISCRYFCNRLFTTLTRRQPRLYMCLVDKAGHRLLLSISSPDNTSFVVVDQDLSIPGMGGYFLNVVRALMCFSLGQNKACIYNPSTKQLLTLPPLKSDIKAERGQKKLHTQYYIGHDPVSDQYKLVCTVGISSLLPRLGNLRSEHWVFALEAGGSWKKVAPLENYLHHAPAPLGRSTSGSVVRYIAWPDNYNCVVVSFDIRSELFTIIPVPREIFAGQDVPAVTMRADLIEYGGKIAIFHHTYLKDEGSADVWVFEDVGKKKNEWSKKTLFLQTCQRHLVQDTELMVRGTTQDGKVILAPVEMHSRFYILYYDLESNDLTKVEIKGVPLPWLHKKCYFDLNYMGDSESFIYLET